MINYRIAKEEDYKNINDFHNRIYRSHRTIEQFRWEFHNAPEGPSIYIIAEDGDKIVGTQCAIPIVLITSKGERIKSGKSEDTLVDPNYRGQNIFNLLYEVLFKECADAGMKVIWGFTSATKPFIRLGFEIPYDHKQVLAVKNISKSYSHLASLNKKNKASDKLKIFGLCFLAKTRFAFNGAGTNLDKFTISREPEMKLENLLESNLKGFPHSFAIEQNEAYMKWRIYDNPNYHKVYTFVLRNASGELVSVITANAMKNKVAFIIQSLFHYELDEKIKSKFMRKVSSELFSDGVIIIRNWTFDHNPYNKEEIENYEHAGYYRVNKGVSLVWKKLGGFEIEPAGFFLSRLATQGVM